MSSNVFVTYCLEPPRIYHIYLVDGFKRCCLSGGNGEHGVFPFFFYTVEIPVIIYDFLVASMLEFFTLVQ